MGKIFNALEKSEKERLIKSEMHRLKKADYMALLKYDRATGKLSDEDYERLHESLTARAIEIMKKIDALPDAGAPAPLGPRPLNTSGEPPA